MSVRSSSLGLPARPQPPLAVLQKTVGQVGEDFDEDTVLQPFADLLGIVAASLGHGVEPTALWCSRLGCGSCRRDTRTTRGECLGAEEQPPVAECLVGVGVARGHQRLGQIDLIEIGRPGMGVPAVEPPLPAIGDDDPVGHALVQGRDDARTRVLFRRFVIEVEIGPIEPAVPGVDEGCGLALGGREQVVGRRVGLARHLVDLRLESQQLEQRLVQLLADDLLPFAQPPLPGVLHHRLDPLEGRGGVVSPGRVFAQAGDEEVVGEQRPVAEILLAESGCFKHAAELVELLQAVAAGPSEPADRTQFFGAHGLAIHGQSERHRLEPPDLLQVAAIAPPLGQQHELQGVKVRGQDQEVFDVGPPQHAGQVVAALGRERPELYEDDAQIAVGIFGEHFQRLDRRRGLPRQADRLGSERLAAAGVVSQTGKEARYRFR
jgi:hypothetical protein